MMMMMIANSESGNRIDCVDFGIGVHVILWELIDDRSPSRDERGEIIPAFSLRSVSLLFTRLIFVVHRPFLPGYRLYFAVGRWCVGTFFVLADHASGSLKYRPDVTPTLTNLTLRDSWQTHGPLLISGIAKRKPRARRVAKIALDDGTEFGSSLGRDKRRYLFERKRKEK